MRTAPTAIAAALLAALTLTACGGSDGGDGGEDGKTGAATPESTKGGACTAAQAGFEIGPSSAAPAAGDEGAVPVTVTNKGDAACTLKGLAGVDLFAGDKSWALKAQEGASQDTEVTLEGGQSMTFTIAYVRGVAGDAEKSAAVDTVKLTLPGDTKVSSFKWPDPEVAVESESTLEATVGPFLPAGD
ncbi:MULTISPECIES: DUF4232 domain-containing protein [Streptomyces]|uniref:DUF4232 domain-containing protein n=1 Tax=Streptomyces stelliscabiei TaxID=146820 RepID=A0A8I0P3Q8_9ACTN|nr:DUF4232 domain-containing protein [Streptomyces stelliscabiei]KND28986.1 lipoprotein [Streptomyces stelliscabiei]MBE1599111.1 hypothetical protein [Streptomyces stelliscabiei]MDX2520032.1 DUF4232 domain-containing protein [Streptomyces stelliscabiei]MDX2552857.1 DUF4232 domain-containing protein [Streptomyces stelliscabiei]MDX2613822.1 DUF4232 domain-containing protein [Streptomyces stelliscabiei]